jgi:purine nucleosidase
MSRLIIDTDPEAAAIVLDAWPSLDLISWETTLAHGISSAQLDALLAVDSPRGDFFRRITPHAIRQTERSFGVRALYAPDGLALEPEIVRRSERHPVRVELSGRHTHGQFVVDWNDRASRASSHAPHDVNLVLELERKRMWELMWAALR